MAAVGVRLIPVEVPDTMIVEEEKEVEVEIVIVAVVVADQIDLTTTDEIETATAILVDLVNPIDTRTDRLHCPANRTMEVNLFDE